MIRYILILVFALMWLSSASFMLGNVSSSPRLGDATEFYGPFNWQVVSQGVGFKNNLPEFLIYGRVIDNNQVHPVVVKADFLEWARSFSDKGRATIGGIFLTQLQERPFVTSWDVNHDAGFSIGLFNLRINLSFIFWAFLTVTLPLIFYSWLSSDVTYVASPQERWKEDDLFEQRVKDIELDYKERSSALRFKTFMLALLGYMVLWGAIALIASIGLGLSFSVDAFMQLGYYSFILALPFFWVSFKLAKSLLIQGGRNSGVQVRPKDVPQLFTLLEKIQSRVKGPSFDKVFIDMEMNASVSRHSGLLGSFGFGPVVLTLGLPLMQSLTTDQLAGVIGHEYGHIAARDNALSHWLYRIRSSWLNIDKNLKAEPLWYILKLNVFYKWFIGVFNAYNFTLSRQCEYDADKMAAKISGAENIAEALVAIEVRHKYISKVFWDRIWQGTEKLSKPFGDPYQKLGIFIKLIDPKDFNIDDIKNKETNYKDTHPSIKDRLRVLGEKFPSLHALDNSAAGELLGNRFENQLALVFDRVWEKHNLKKWYKLNRDYQSAVGFMDSIADKKLSNLTEDELYTAVTAAHTIGAENKVIDVCEEITIRNPKNIVAKVNLLGYRLTHDKNESALLELDDLMNVHPEQLPAICRFAVKYLEEQGRYEEAKVYQFRLDDWKYKSDAAEEERKNIYPSDVFVYHSVSPEYVKKINAVISKKTNVSKAWMVQKKIGYFKEKPLFVIVLKQSMFGFRDRNKIVREIKRAMSKAGFPQFFSFFWVDEVKGLKKKIEKIEGSLIYKK